MAAKAKNVPFADLSSIIGNKSYQAKVGTVCEGPINQDGTKGKPIKVTKVASTHPGDKGMKYIANAVMKELNKYIHLKPIFSIKMGFGLVANRSASSR